MIDDVVPRPDQDAGSQALLSRMAALRALGWQVEFVAASELAGAAGAASALAARASSATGRRT